MRGGQSLTESSVKTLGRIKPRKTLFLMVEGVSEEVYFNRIARLSEKYSLSVKVSKDKDCLGIINNCARESKRIGLEKDDLRAAVFDLDVVDRKTLEEAKKKAEKENILLLTTNLSFEFWLLLHLEENPRVHSQDEYEALLSQHLGYKYKKSKGIKDKVNLDSIEDAVKRAKKILNDSDPIACKTIQNSTNLWKIVSTILDLGE